MIILYLLPPWSPGAETSIPSLVHYDRGRKVKTDHGILPMFPAYCQFSRDKVSSMI
jgi:hypothetical protein